MSNMLLYSTNVFLKQLIQAAYRGDVHYVWCSDSFDSTKLPGYSVGALGAPSSNPADIYRELKRDVDRNDFHSAKIAAQKASFKSLAVKWEKSGEITKAQKQEIVYMVDNAPINYWRPLLYVIPYDLVQSRVQIVPIALRASFANEYVIPDLARSEFHLIEL